MRFTGRCWVYGDDVNTDVIFPGKYTYTLTDISQFAAHALEDLDPDFARLVEPGDIVVGGKNFGCGSSREQAAVCLKMCGVRVIIAKSFARIFFRNCVNNGVLPIICPEAVAVIQKGDVVTVDVTQATITGTPHIFRATAACSRDDPQPKFLPPTIMSPGWTSFANSGSRSSSACAAN